MSGTKNENFVTITVTQLNTIAKNLLESCKELTDVWVSGEVSNLTKHGSGHYYFTLKDERSEIKCTFFRYARCKVSLEIEENMKILALGSMSVYIPKGGYQFNVQDVRSQGLGELHLAFEALKKKLDAEGLFEVSRKRPLPHYPNRIGVVTSPTGAAIRDILTVTARRFPADILLAPALVQGEGAGASIVKGICLLNEAGVDVMIVGRGGGSLEDLWAFNEEAVARAIFASKAPVVSAVGHETDLTISDLVADLRAPTPSAAAELVLPDREDEERNLMTLLVRAQMGLKAPLESMRRRLATIERAFSPRIVLSEIEQHGMRLDELSGDLEHHIRRRLDSDAGRLKALQASLDGLDPMRVLGRGYSILQSIDGSVLSSVGNVNEGDVVRIVMRDGVLEAEVTRKG